MSVPIERTIIVTVDVAPEGSGPELADWCMRHGGYVLAGSRRAWLDPYKTYLRDAVGIAETRTGERFLVCEEDFDE